jgi:hypothetical protein
MCTARFRDAIRNISERTYLKHEAKMKTSRYPIVSVTELLSRLSLSILSTSTKPTLCAYNITWDFEAIANLIRIFCESPIIHPSFDARCENPFNPLRLHHVDIMHEIIKKFGQRLVNAGIQDGTVSRTTNNTRTMLRKGGQKFSKTVYSAEYALHHLLGITQQHLADKDVEHEALLLQYIIQNCTNGPDDLEYGILYPQRSCYHHMIKLANTTMSIEDDNDNDEHDEVAPEVVTTERLAIQVLQRMHQPQNCLFVDSE